LWAKLILNQTAYSPFIIENGKDLLYLLMGRAGDFWEIYKMKPE